MDKWLSIPKNEIGEQEYDTGIDESPNIVSISFPEREVDALFEDGVIELINEKCSLGIDAYEHEEIPRDTLKNVKDLVNKELYPVFYEAIEVAIKLDMPLMIDL